MHAQYLSCTQTCTHTHTYTHIHTPRHTSAHTHTQAHERARAPLLVQTHCAPICLQDSQRHVLQFGSDKLIQSMCSRGNHCDAIALALLQECSAKGKTSEALTKLLHLMPESATVWGHAHWGRTEGRTHAVRHTLARPSTP